MFSNKLVIFIFGYCCVLFSLNFKLVLGAKYDSEPLTERTYLRKCKEYQKSCSPDLSPIEGNSEEATAKEFPHMALIGDVDDEKPNQFLWFCSGTLISDLFVLTAAHCLGSRYHSAKYVRLGDLDFETEEDDAQVSQFNVVKQFIHPDFKAPSVYNDIALLKLDKIVQFNQYIQPACLPHIDYILSERALVTGWGITSSSWTIHSSLQKVPLHPVSYDQCKESYENSKRLLRGIDDQIQVCAGGALGERDACQGFAGAPLTNAGSKCVYEVFAISSFGKGCGGGIPGVYTRVIPYIDWIENIVWS